MPSVAIVLPPREAFATASAGAVAMVARSHARHGALPCVVLGRPVPRPFEGTEFRPVSPKFWPGREAIRYAAAASALLRELRPDLIEVHNRPDVALFLARRFPAVSLFLHNDPQGMRAARTAAQRARLQTRLARVFAVSQQVADRFGTGPGVSLLPNGIELPLPSGPKRQCILFAGRVVADKGADLFVDACGLALPQLAGWSARMIGADRFGPDSPSTPFLRDLKPRAKAADVAMDGFLPHPDVLAALAEAAIVVVPGRWPEPFGLVALEALASGAALIFTPFGGLPDVVGSAGVAVPPDARAIADAIVALARSPERRVALAVAGRSRAEHFDVRRVVARLDAERSAILATWSPPKPPPI